MEKRQLVIIGGGSAGMAAAVAAYDKGIRDILIIERTAFLGGILNQCIHNGFGLHEFKEELTGPEFLTRFAKQVEERGIEVELEANVLSLTKDKVVTYISKKGEKSIQAEAVVNAAGCYERNSGAIGIPGTRPAGVITAGQAQLYLNEYGYMVGKKVFILGSGDIGLIMARRMTLEGAKVLGVAEIMPYSNGLNRNIQQCLKDFDIPLYLSHTVSKIIGKEHLEAIEISKVDEKMAPIPGTEMRFEVDTLLLSIGLIPNNSILDQAGAILGSTRGSKVNQNMETSIPGVFSAGNVLHVHDLVDYVVEEGRQAGEAAAKYLQEGEQVAAERIECVPGEGIGYVVPSWIDLASAGENIPLKFRCRKPTKNVYISISFNGVEIKKMLKLAMIPSEMEIIKLPKSLLNANSGKLEVALRPKGE